MTERAYQAALIRRLNKLFPGIVIIKNDPELFQGIPDLTLLWGERWAMLEVKADVSSAVRPNQEYWVDVFNRMSFADFIYPQNEREVLDALRQALGA